MSIMQSGVVEVKLTRGLVTIIDAEDLELVSQHKWRASRGSNTDYAVRAPRIRGTHRREEIKLHRVLTNAPDGVHVDHVNGNGLDNRKSNLRLCTSSENSRNRQKPKGCSSEFKGVGKRQWGKCVLWEARIYVDKKRYTKSFPTELEAAQWYDEMAMELFGEFAKLNFPDATVKHNE
jgi:hypothetical protein